MKNLTLPLWQMTGGDIIELLKENWGYITKTDTPQFCTTLTTQPNYVYGIVAQLAAIRLLRFGRSVI